MVTYECLLFTAMVWYGAHLGTVSQPWTAAVARWNIWCCENRLVESPGVGENRLVVVQHE